MGMARSLNDAARLASRTTSLILRASEDLVCRNLMCAKVGGACVCRLALCVSRLSDLRELDVADNDLGVLPDSLFELARLERLDISGNGLKALPAGISGLTSLRTLRLSNNLLTRLPPELKCLSLLEELHVGGNHGLKQEDLKTLHRHRPALRIIDGDQKGVAAQGSCAMNESDDRSGAIDTVI